MIYYKNCPACENQFIVPVLKAKDHTVSGEVFEIWSCKNCGLRFTQDAPELEVISAYYKSENYISHTDTQSGFINKLYHTVRKKTLRSKKYLVEKTTGKNKGNILDIGCGTGAFLHIMNKSGWNITGIEPDTGAAKKAAELYGIAPLRPEMLYELPPGCFDVITLWHVLEHVHDLGSYMDKLRELLAPGGKLFVAVPNYKSYDARYYKEFWAAWDVPRHLYHFSPLSMQLLFQKHGLRLIDTKPMWFDSFYVSMLSEKYKNGSGAVKGAVIGAISNLRAMANKKKASSIIYVGE